MKKLLFILTATFLPFYTHAWEPCGTDANGNTANCEYQIIDGTLTIRGVGNNGNIGSWKENKSYAPWYNKGVTNVVIEDSIKDLGYQAFSGITSHNPIIVPSSIEYISLDAFKGLHASEVIIPDSVTSIRGYSFCFSQIEKIDIPDSVTYISAYAFLGAKQLTDIVIPDSVKNVYQGAFGDCTNLKTLTIGENTILSKIFKNYEDEGHFDTSNLKIYCTGDTAKCDANLEAAGYSELKSIAVKTKKINGVTYVYDKNGKLVTSSGQRREKRIYTIDEANTVAGDKNRVSITYR